MADNENPWTVFIETLDPESKKMALPPFDKDCKLTRTYLSIAAKTLLDIPKDTLVKQQHTAQLANPASGNVSQFLCCF